MFQCPKSTSLAIYIEQLERESKRVYAWFKNQRAVVNPPESLHEVPTSLEHSRGVTIHWCPQLTAVAIVTTHNKLPKAKQNRIFMNVVRDLSACHLKCIRCYSAMKLRFTYSTQEFSNNTTFHIHEGYCYKPIIIDIHNPNKLVNLHKNCGYT